MKVSRIVSQSKEYERLQRLINNIETAIEHLEKPQELPGEWVTGTIALSGYDIRIDDKKVKFANILLSSDVSEVISSDLKQLLNDWLIRFKGQQEELEV